MQAIAGPLAPEYVTDLEEAYAPPGGFGPAAGGWVRANMTTSLDGAAHLDGVSGGLSGVADKAVFRTLRGLADVVLVGSGTVTAEGYRPARVADSTRRLGRGQSDVPVIAVVSRSLSMDPGTPLFSTPGTLVLTCSDAPAERRALFPCEVVDCGTSSVDVVTALDVLAERGLRQVLCEGGPSLLAELLAAGRLDELDLTLAPLVVGPGASRIVKGAQSAVRQAALEQLLTEDGFLFARYLLAR